MKKLLVSLLLVVFAGAFTFAAGLEEYAPKPEPQPDIIEVAVSDGRFTTLAAALGAAGLIETLQGEGPFTVFAPTDDAFAKLPAGTVEALLNDIPTLTNILLYHVVPGRVMASEVVSLSSAGTVLGKDVGISVMGGRVKVNDSEVIITDIEASNGVIHVIDSVLLPPEDLPSIVDIAVSDGRFTTLTAALAAAGLVETLQGEGPFTVFAPTDDAFAKLPAGTVEALINDIPTLTDILLYHVVSGKVMAADVVGLSSANAVNGDAIRISLAGGGVALNDSKVIITDIEAENGVIHVIDSVLLPPQ
jgi:transforming growth factor-beta-induced protein